MRRLAIATGKTDMVRDENHPPLERMTE